MKIKKTIRKKYQGEAYVFQPRLYNDLLILCIINSEYYAINLLNSLLKN